MEFEKMYFDVEPSYIIDHHCCSLETALPFQNNHLSFQDYVSNDIVSTENFLEMETDIKDFDSIAKNCALDHENVVHKRLLPCQEIQETMDILAAEQSHLKDIQDELMEESSLTDLLLMGAEAIEAGNVRFASLVALRLKDILSDQENGDNPMDRLALYFTQGLLDKSLAPPELPEDPVSQQTNAITAFQMVQELSPYVKFAHFTANQAILEAAEGLQEIHVIDFDVMEGIQWPSLMVDLAAREDASLRITAIVGDKRSSCNIQQTGFRLQDFANSINLSFSFDQVLVTKEEDFEEIKVGHTLIANCMINQLHMPCRESSLVKTFFNGLRKLSPKILVLVQEELFSFSKAPSTSFAEFFCEALDHYTALSDSLRSGFCGGYKLALKIIEREFLRKRILDSVKHFPCGIMGNESNMLPDYPSMNGFRPIPMSSCNVTQAKHLISLFNGGYWVQNEHCKLTLCWKSRPLTTASIWVPTASSKTSLARSTYF
ncbi:nodulation-signaling pathway 2 protein-like [Coffea eugenioides]|uniref:nodulation-signaling pathway 2 protein-like n=1 Tax=Coffea eugenioides TaxID=49369 RepID=UPI000F604676|nr:nodulation-signaling pathway 2 protein-like [Coffea eugenioides]